MTQLQMEDELWQSRRMREAEEKKILILNQENKKLHEKLEDLQDSIDKKSKKISRLNSQNESLKQERNTLQNKLAEAISKCSRIQTTLQEKNEEYCKLYSYLFTESRNAIQKSFLAEMNLNTQISELQHQTDAKIIQKLQLKIKQKNQECLSYQKRICQLHEALLTSTFEYQEKISELQNQKRVLQIEFQSKYVPEQEESETINEYCFKKKIEGLQNEVCLYTQQIQRLRQELKDQTKQFKRLQQRNTELEILESKREQFKNINDEIFTVIEDNNKMRDQIEELQKEKENLIDNIPYFEDQQTLLGRLYTLEKEYIQLKNQSASLNTQNQLLRTSKHYLQNKNEQLLETQASATKRYESLKIISTSAFQKLKNVIKTYSPYYFRSLKLESYDLNKEQQQLIKGQTCEETLASAYKQINIVQRENENFKQQNIELSQRLFELKNTNQQLEKELKEKKQEIEKLGTACLQLIQKNNENQQNRDLMDQQQQEEIVKKNLQIKVEILRKSVEEYQIDRREIINMIKSKDLKIAQLSAEIEALKNINDATVIYIKPSPIQTFIQRVPVESSKQSQMIFQGSLAELRSQLISISKAHNEEKQQLIRQYERKQSESLTKYFALLKQYDFLCEKLSKLESSALNIAKNSQLIQEQKYSIIQEAPSVFHHVQSRQQNPQQNTFSEKAIQTFTDILKKYEKQINKYVTIYEEQLKKWTKKADQQLYSGVAEESVMGNNKQIQNLLQIVKKHQETIINLEETNQKTTKEFQILIMDLQNQLHTQNIVNKQLANRLDEAEKTILTIRNNIFEQKFSFDFSSSQSANTAFLTLNLKNKQIQVLKKSYQKLKQCYEQKCKQTVCFTEKSTNLSAYELQQLKVFKEIIQKQDLLGILQEAAKRLQ